MKLKYKFVIREVGGTQVAVAVGKDNELFNGMIKLNKSGELIFRLLNEGGADKKTLEDALIEKYDITHELASKTVEEFLTHLETNGILEE